MLELFLLEFILSLLLLHDDFAPLLDEVHQLRVLLNELLALIEHLYLMGQFLSLLGDQGVLGYVGQNVVVVVQFPY